jgi:hypothetical protein
LDSPKSSFQRVPDPSNIWLDALRCPEVTGAIDYASMSWIGERTAREKSMMYRTGVVQKRQGVSGIPCTFSCSTLNKKAQGATKAKRSSRVVTSV